MKTYEITMDVMTTLRTRIEAESQIEALKIAGREAYEDTWGSKAVYSGVELVDVELEEDS